MQRPTPEDAAAIPPASPIPVAEIVLDASATGAEASYTYAIPPELAGSMRIGLCVHVPFAHRELTGHVIALRTLPSSDPLSAKLRPLLGIIHGAVSFTAEQARLAAWIASETLCAPATAVRCVAPPQMDSHIAVELMLIDRSAAPIPPLRSQERILSALERAGGTTRRDQLKRQLADPGFNTAARALVRAGAIAETRTVERPRVVQRITAGFTLGDPPPSGARISAAARRILAVLTLQTNPTPIPMAALLGEAACSSAPLRTLVQAGFVRRTEIVMRRAPAIAHRDTVAPQLTSAQEGALAAVRTTAAEGACSALLFGVTGSGKTEIYLRAIADEAERGRSAIVLLPEIALTSQVVEVFAGRFGSAVAVLHSGLSDGERHDEWRRIETGEARIVVGARSAVFAPVTDLGLIIVDEEHEASYKQDSAPRYSARGTALHRASASGAAAVLGSATPSVETFHDALAGRHRLIRLPQRIAARPMPVVRVVDMREEWKVQPTLFSSDLVDSLRETLAAGRQSILFLNRRGFARFVLCRDCGTVTRCPNCAVSLTLHAGAGLLRCHHCAHEQPLRPTCPDCGGSRMKPFGIGTERVEEEVRRILPDARIARLDRDTTAHKDAHSEILGAVRAGEVDVLVGTQMVAKGLDFPNVTLVGVVAADTGLNIPDFRAAERTFQVLTQVAGRAGRGEIPGAVVVQAFAPEHFAVQCAMKHDYEAFYEKEIAYRSELAYPPFTRLANLVVADENEQAATDRIDALAAVVRRSAAASVEVIGPAPAPLSRLRGQFRRHLVLRAPVDSDLAEVVRAALRAAGALAGSGLTIDIDPVHMA